MLGSGRLPPLSSDNVGSSCAHLPVGQLAMGPVDAQLAAVVHLHRRLPRPLHKIIKHTLSAMQCAAYLFTRLLAAHLERRPLCPLQGQCAALLLSSRSPSGSQSCGHQQQSCDRDDRQWLGAEVLRYNRAKHILHERVAICFAICFATYFAYLHDVVGVGGRPEAHKGVALRADHARMVHGRQVAEHLSQLRHSVS